MPTSVTQFGVTFTFSEDRTVGNFADGSYWVLGPVTINSITPDAAGERNGWEVNPIVRLAQAFTSEEPNGTYDASLMPSLPYLADSAQSIVKTITQTGSGISTTYVKTAVVLTVLMEEPAGGGAGFFRPPYVGTAKPLFAVSSLRTDLLPSLAPVGSPPSFATIITNFSQCLRMDHNNTWPRLFRPADAMANYQPSNVAAVNEAMLRMMLDDPVEDKLPALIQLTQPCIDRLYAVMGGYRQGSSGHNPGHRTMAGWAAVMLDHTEGKEYLALPAGSNESYQEESFLAKRGDRTLWGIPTSTETQYWNYLRFSTGSQSNSDPYGLIDGGRIVDHGGAGGIGSSYQVILSLPMKSAALLTHIMPALQVSFRPAHYPLLVEYTDRWVSHGVWSSPDGAAPYTEGGTYEVDYGPDPGNPGSPIQGDGRYPEFHGANADGGQNGSAFATAMWNAYRDYEPPPTPPAARGRKRRGAKLLSFFR
jgi:hypothetical protein